MAGRYTSLSRSLMSSARASSLLRSLPPLPRLRPPPTTAPRLHRRRLSATPPRNLGELGCVQSLLPFSTAAMLSHLSSQAQACCELSHGMNGKDG